MKRVKKLTATLALWAAASLPLQAAEPVTLGLNFPRSGPYKEEGLAQMRGALLAIDEVNAQGGVLGRPLRLVSKDSASRPEKAVRNGDKLAEEGAAMLFGGAASAVAIVMFVMVFFFYWIANRFFNADITGGLRG